jgi:hypothetical protein
MQKEIYDFMKNHMDLLIDQTKSYVPFIRTAFPTASMSDACFNLIVGNAFYVFLGQYAMRIRSPSEQDLAEFGALVNQYRGRVEEIFK